MLQQQLLVLLQSFAACAFLILPMLLIARIAYRKTVPNTHMLRMSNWTDSIIRPVALVLFLLMIASVFYFFVIKPDFYALIAPIVFTLGFFFFPLYKRMQ